MSTTRPFAYNTGSQIDGTEQAGDLSIGFPTSGFLSTGLKWWNGPDEELGYVIARANNNGRPGADGNTAYLGFWRSSSLTDQSFIDLGNRVLSSNYTVANDLKAALISAGYWTSYGLGGTTIQLGDYFLSTAYEPAPNNGDIVLPSHPSDAGSPTGYASVNPNLVGQVEHVDEFGIKAGNFKTMLYINTSDATNTDQSAILNQLVGSSGTLKLTQGSNSVVYGFTNQSFFVGSSTIYYDTLLSSAPSTDGSITLITPASADFNTTTPITIDITID